MRYPSKAFICGACKVPVESPIDPEPDDEVSCPRCGVRDRYEDARKIAFDHIAYLFESAKDQGLARLDRVLGSPAPGKSLANAEKPFFKWEVRDLPLSEG
jgi:DNA-directed RNA polymerase subunit RPC12/RpoP